MFEQIKNRFFLMLALSLIAISAAPGIAKANYYNCIVSTTNDPLDPETVADDDLDESLDDGYGSSLRGYIEGTLSSSSTTTTAPCEPPANMHEPFDQIIVFATLEYGYANDVNEITLDRALNIDTNYETVAGMWNPDYLDEPGMSDLYPSNYALSEDAIDYGLIIVNVRDSFGSPDYANEAKSANKPFTCVTGTEDLYLRNMIVNTNGWTKDAVIGTGCIKDAGMLYVCEGKLDEDFTSDEMADAREALLDSDSSSIASKFASVTDYILNVLGVNSSSFNPFAPNHVSRKLSQVVTALGDTGHTCYTVAVNNDRDDDGHDSEASGGDDCDDTNSNVHPGAVESCDDVDNDCDGDIDEASWCDETEHTIPETDHDIDNDGYLDNGDPTTRDCNDVNPQVHPGALDICDGQDDDCDGFIDEDCDADGHSNPSVDPAGDDCDDTNPTVYTGAREICDSIDNDCDGSIDEGLLLCGFDFDLDKDDDGYLIFGDCDDTDATINPGAMDLCADGIDQDCSGDDSTEICGDNDHDGYTVDTGDCDDANPTVYPGAPEIMPDGIDNDCDTLIDEDVVSSPTDLDGDGHDNTASGGDDCDDGNAAVYPGATEICDGFDNNCDGTVNEDTSDVDGDGYCDEIDPDADGDGHFDTSFSGGDDCNDADASIHPDAVELCDGVDNNCNSFTDENCPSVDADHDGYTVDTGDCDDANPMINPAALEMPDGVDNNCDGSIDEGFTFPDANDTDGDGHDNTASGGDDCDDTNPTIYPGATEICDLFDNNCDGTVNEGVSNIDGDDFCDLMDPDADGDGYIAESVPSGDDCDDTNLTIHPNADESTLNDIDNDCDGLIDEDYTDPNVDNDGDGFTENEGDCDDSATGASVYPGATEICDDGIDNNCDGHADTDSGICVGVDADADSYPAGTGTLDDCNDSVAEINPGVVEICDDTIDNNCDGLIDAADTVTCPITSAVDGDGDGYIPVAAGGNDCDDTDATINPAATELCNDVTDNNCDGLIDAADTITCPATSATDADGDGYFAGSDDGFDCDDTDATINPAAVEVCGDTVDNNCDDLIDDADTVTCPVVIGTDTDGDGYFAEVDDCDDADGAVNPAATEVCNGFDDNCDSVVDDGLSDVDGDGTCDQLDIELCDGIDNDGDSLADEGFDTNGDGIANCFEVGTVNCADGIDNDGDSIVDCADASCFSVAACNDTNNVEICGDGLDNDGDLAFDCYDGDCAADATCLSIDSDLDGYTSVSDCDDFDADINPGATESCQNAVDDNCDGTTNENCVNGSDESDDDLDGYCETGGEDGLCDVCTTNANGVVTCPISGDCDDTDANINPSMSDSCETDADDNCDGIANPNCSIGDPEPDVAGHLVGGSGCGCDLKAHNSKPQDMIPGLLAMFPLGLLMSLRRKLKKIR